MKQLIKKYEDLNIALRKKTFYVNTLRKYELKGFTDLTEIEIKIIRNAQRNIDILDVIINRFDNDLLDIILDFQNDYFIQSNKKLSKYASIKTDKKELELFYLYLLITILETDRDSFLNNARLVFLGILTEDELLNLMIINNIDINNNNKRGMK